MGKSELRLTEILALSLIKGIGVKAMAKLMAIGNSYSTLTSLDTVDLKRCIRSNQAIEELQQNAETYLERAERILLQYDDTGITLVSRWCPKYPKGFEAVSDPPQFLYCRGNTDLLSKKEAVAVVGTRKCTNTGYTVAHKTALHFAKNGYNIVSGLASGIDTAAHEGALEAGGKTTAIVVDIRDIYPQSNIPLVERILASGGLVFSENPPGTTAIGRLFVQRDRLQSGLSLAVFPIETDIKGGTMHTVRFAVEQGKLLYCPDYSGLLTYEDRMTKGVRKLIDEGTAKPYTVKHYPDILEDLKSLTTPKPPPEQLDLGI